MKWQKIFNLIFNLIFNIKNMIFLSMLSMLSILSILILWIWTSPNPAICALEKPQHNHDEITAKYPKYPKYPKYHSYDITHYAQIAFKYIFSLHKKDFCFGKITQLPQSHNAHNTHNTHNAGAILSSYSYTVAKILQNKSFNIFKLWIIIWKILILLISILLIKCLIKYLIKYLKKNINTFVKQQIMEIREIHYG